MYYVESFFFFPLSSTVLLKGGSKTSHSHVSMVRQSIGLQLLRLLLYIRAYLFGNVYGSAICIILVREL